MYERIRAYVVNALRIEYLGDTKFSGVTRIIVGEHRRGKIRFWAGKLAENADCGHFFLRGARGQICWRGRGRVNAPHDPWCYQWWSLKRGGDFLAILYTHKYTTATIVNKTNKRIFEEIFSTCQPKSKHVTTCHHKVLVWSSTSIKTFWTRFKKRYYLNVILLVFGSYKLCTFFERFAGSFLNV